MRRVFHVVTHFDLGGAERVAAAIASGNGGDEEHHVVEVVRARSSYTAVFLEELSSAGIRYHRAHMPEYHFHYLFERLAALCFPLWFLFVFLKWRPDVVHSHTEVPDMGVSLFFTLFPRLRRRCRIVRTIHNTLLWSGMKPTGRLVERFMQRHAVNVSVSQAVKEAYEREYGDGGEVIYNGVEEVAQKAYDGIVEGRVNVLFAGRMEPQKGIAALLATVRRMEGDSRFHFHVIGSGSLSGQVRGELGGCANVTLRPVVYNLAACLAAFDCVFMPSVHEGLGLLSVEASLNGTLPLINDCPGLRETVPDTWLLKAAGNSVDDYVRLFDVVADPARRKDLSDEARRFAARRFAMEAMREAYSKVYAG